MQEFRPYNSRMKNKIYKINARMIDPWRRLGVLMMWVDGLRPGDNVELKIYTDEDPTAISKFVTEGKPLIVNVKPDRRNKGFWEISVKPKAIAS